MSQWYWQLNEAVSCLHFGHSDLCLNLQLCTCPMYFPSSEAFETFHAERAAEFSGSGLQRAIAPASDLVPAAQVSPVQDSHSEGWHFSEGLM